MSTPQNARETMARLICPGCPAARATFERTEDPSREACVIRCLAPRALQEAYGYPRLCQHVGPFLDPEEVLEWQDCPVLRELLRRLPRH